MFETKSTGFLFVAFAFAVTAAASSIGCAVPTADRERKASSESSLAFDGDSPTSGTRYCGNERPACPSSTYCAPLEPNAQGPDLPGTCELKRGEGSTCVSGGQPRGDMCAAGLVCVAAGTSAYCLPPTLHGAGEYCDGDYYQCQAGLNCNASGTCVAPAPAAPAGPAPTSGPQPGDYGGSCAGFNDATYCGLNYIKTGDPSILYTCRGGQLTVQQVCANGCNAIRGPQNDHCL